MTRTLSADQLTRYVGIRVRNPAAANRYWARCMGRDIAADAAIDDETAAKIKEFLKEKLSASDHETLCSMLAGDVEAQDTEPSPDDVETFNTGDTTPPLPGTPRPGGGMDARQHMQAADNAIAKRAQARDDFFARFPDAARIGIDNSGIQPRGRASSYSAAGAASFAAMFPDAMKIRLL